MSFLVYAPRFNFIFMLSKEEVKNIAALARIGLNEDEIEKYRKDISSILDYFQKLNELDTDSIKPIGHITGRENISREDRVEDAGDIGIKEILKNAPETKGGYVKVKSVF